MNTTLAIEIVGEGTIDQLIEVFACIENARAELAPDTDENISARIAMRDAMDSIGQALSSLGWDW